MFYQKIPDTVISDENARPELSSMSYCRLKTDIDLKLPELAFDLDLRLIMRGVSAQFVSKEQYQQLLFILGQKGHNETGITQNYTEILSLFNNFHTNSHENIQHMLAALEFLFPYNMHKSIAQNRRDFKDFFSYLTNIRCAVVEGSHRCEAACRTLQGYLLGDHIPLEYNELDVPASSTLFKKIATEVYSIQDEHMMLEVNIFDYLKEKSKKLAEQKELIVFESWHSFFTRVLEDINNNSDLSQVIFEKQADFYRGEVNYNNIGKDINQSNKIRKCLHQILSNAIFHYCPCMDLIQFCKKAIKPTAEEWEECNAKWLSLNAEPYQLVSDSIC